MTSCTMASRLWWKEIDLEANGWAMELGASSNVNDCSDWDIPSNDQQQYLNKLHEKLERKSKPENSTMSKSLSRLNLQTTETVNIFTDLYGDVDPEELDSRPLIPRMDRSDVCMVSTNGRTVFFYRCCKKFALLLYRLYAYFCSMIT